MSRVFTQVRPSGVQADPDNVYYNATIINNTVQTNQQTNDPQVFFQDTRQTPLVRDSALYEVSVENFTLNGSTKTLPIYVPQINPTSASDVTTTSLTITFGLRTGSNYYTSTRPIVWVPENQASFTVIPNTAQPNQLAVDYYLCYSYSHLIDLINTALRQAYADVTGASGTNGTNGTTCPFFEFDQTTGLMSLNQDAVTSVSMGPTTQGSTTEPTFFPFGTALPQPYAMFGTTNATVSGFGTYQTSETSWVGFNANLEGLLTNFDTIYYGYNGKAFGGSTAGTVFNNSGTPTTSTQAYYPENIVVNAPKTNPLNYYTLTSVFPTASTITPAYIRQTQDFIATGSLWSPVASIVLATSQLPVRNEAVGAPVSLGTGNNVGGQAIGNFQKVLLETPINAVTADLWRGFINYQPLTPTFSSLDPCIDGITNIDIQVFWRSRLTNALIPLLMYNGGSMSIRLLFQKRRSV